MSAFDGLVALAQKYNEMEAIVKELAKSDPWIPGESSLCCYHCKAQRLYGGDEKHTSGCLRLRAKALVSDYG